MSKNQDIFRRHGAIALLGIVALLASAGCNNDGGASETPSATTPAMDPALAGPEGNGGMMPGGPPMGGAMGAPMGSPGVGATGSFKSGTRPNSWSTAPKSVQLAAAGMAAQGGGFGGQMPGGGGGAPTGGSKPSPIQEGKREAKYRNDPFVSFFKQVVELPAAYTLALPRRLAKIPVYTPPSDETIPVDIRLGPLPPVPRRVAGVLYNGAITAILETGITPDSEVVVIQPGASVRSGVPGIPALTVESITMDRLILRAVDGRTVEVKLSGLPPSVAAALGGQFGNQGGGFGGPPGGFGGPPGGFGGPAGRGGGPGSGASVQ